MGAWRWHFIDDVLTDESLTDRTDSHRFFIFIYEEAAFLFLYTKEDFFICENLSECEKKNSMREKNRKSVGISAICEKKSFQ